MMIGLCRRQDLVEHGWWWSTSILTLEIWWCVMMDDDARMKHFLASDQSYFEVLIDSVRLHCCWEEAVAASSQGQIGPLLSA